MEIMEKETKIENLSAGDFLQKKSTNTNQQQAKDGDVAVIILLYKNPNFRAVLKPYDLEIYGKKMWKWLELACDDYAISTAVATPDSEVLSLIKPLLNDKKYTMVLYSDTPLLSKPTIEEILTYVKAKECNVLNLTRGYVFNTEYIKNIVSIQNNLVVRFNEEDFVTAYDLKQTEFIGGILKSRILDYHLLNGVIIQDINSTYIDGDVIIESGVIIEPNNIIKGKSYVGKHTFLESGNKIIDSVIGENCVLKASYIYNSKVEKNIVVGPFEKVLNKY